MPTNDFLTFADAGGANVISQADYVALSTRADGFVAGIAHSDEFNKVWRQSSFVTSAISALMSSTLSVDVLDNGNVSDWQSTFSDLIAALSGSADIGLWTPTITADPTPGTVTYEASSQAGTYYRLGNFCYLAGALGIASWTGSPSGAIEITGLPFVFTIGSFAASYLGQLVVTGDARFFNNGTAKNPISVIAGPGGTSIFLYSEDFSSSTSGTQLSISDVDLTKVPMEIGFSIIGLVDP